jgi:cytochrome b
MKPGSEKHTKEGTIILYDAIIRLPIGTVVNAKARIKVTKRFGEVLATPVVYNVAGPDYRGVSGMRLLLKRIE